MKVVVALADKSLDKMEWQLERIPRVGEYLTIDANSYRVDYISTILDEGDPITCLACHRADLPYLKEQEKSGQTDRA